MNPKSIQSNHRHLHLFYFPPEHRNKTVKYKKRVKIKGVTLKGIFRNYGKQEFLCELYVQQCYFLHIFSLVPNRKFEYIKVLIQIMKLCR